MIKRNAHKYSISAQCEVLGISRGSYYYEVKQPKDETALEEAVQTAFEESRSLYGSRKLKKILTSKGITLSRRKICRIMKCRGLESAYTKRKYKNHSKDSNKSKIPNLINRKFDDRERLAVVVSDLTYVRVGQRWNYICILLDLHNREIIGYSSGIRKDAMLVCSAFSKASVNLSKIQIFHTDRGSEFNNMLIDEVLEAFGIDRSLSIKGNPYDNAVAEATFKLIKTEFVNRRIFTSEQQLSLELMDYVNWFNNIRIHSSLGYVSPVQFRKDRGSALCFLFS